MSKTVFSDLDHLVRGSAIWPMQRVLHGKRGDIVEICADSGPTRK